MKPQDHEWGESVEVIPGIAWEKRCKNCGLLATDAPQFCEGRKE
jgi:hypothetical protein